MATKFQNALFDTMIQFAEHSNAVSKAAKTIEGTIVGKSTIPGVYKVNYLGNIIEASSNGFSYNKDEAIYCLVPEGDFSKTITIIGTVIPRERNLEGGGSGSSGTDPTPGTVDTDETKDYFTLYELYENNSNIGLKSLKSIALPTNDETTVTLFSASSDNTNILKEYLSNGESLKIAFNIRTDFVTSGQTASGNYGLELIQENDEKTVVLAKIDTQKIDSKTGGILGSFNNFIEGSDQSFIFNNFSSESLLEDGEFKVRFYCYGYDAEEKSTYVNDIIFSEFKIDVMREVPSANQNGYKLYIKPSESNFFAENTSNTKTLTPVLKLNGNELTGGSYYDNICWFIEDRSINSEEKSGYDRRGGLGWRMLSSTGSTLTVKKADLTATAANYKCILDYDQMTLFAETEIKNFLFSSFVILKAKNVSGVYSEDTDVELEIITYADGVTNAATPKDVYYYISRYDSVGNYKGYLSKDYQSEDKTIPFKSDGNIYTFTFDDKEYKCFYTIVKFPANEIVDFNNFYCSVVKMVDEQEVNLGSDSQRIYIGTNVENSPYKIIINGTPKNHQYDTYGNSPLTKVTSAGTYREVETLECIIKYNTEEIEKVTTENGETVYKNANITWKIPEHSLICVPGQDMPEISGDGFYRYPMGSNNKFVYSIKDSFNAEDADGQMVCEVEVDGEVIEVLINVSCTQTGRQGSNGTGYTAMLTWDGAPYRSILSGKVEKKLKFWYNKSNGNIYYYNFSLKDWVSAGNRELELKVFNNGAAADNTEYDVSFCMFKSSDIFSVAKSGNKAVLTFNSSKINNANVNLYSIVQAKVSLKKGSSTIEKEMTNKTIYCYYPLEIVVSSGNIDFNSIDGGYSEVLYSSEGVDPIYDDNFNFEAATSGGDWNCSSNFELDDVKMIVDGSEQIDPYHCKATPAAIFNQLVVKNFISYSIGTTVYYRPILLYCNRYGREALNDWDGTVDVNSEGGYILAPQVGAGKKDGDSFTGVLMGKVSEDGKPIEEGLIGLNKGDVTFKLSAEDGSATFGKSGSGQIKFIPNDGGYIAGWQIKENYLSSNNNNVYICSGEHNSFNNENDGFYLGPNGLSIGSKFSVSETGHLYGSDLILISGEHNSFNSQENGFYLSSDGLSIGKNFWVDSEGNAHGTDFEGTNFIANTSIQLTNNGYKGAFGLGAFTTNIYDQYTESPKKAITFLNTPTAKSFYGVNFHDNYYGNSGFRILGNLIVDTGKVSTEIGEVELNTGGNLYINNDAFVHNNLAVSGTTRLNTVYTNRLTWESYTRGHFYNAENLSAENVASGYNNLYNHIVNNAGEWELTGNVFKDLQDKLGYGAIYPTAYFWEENLKSREDDDDVTEEKHQYYSSSLIPSVRFMMSYVQAKLKDGGGSSDGSSSGGKLNVVSCKELPETLEKNTIYLIRGEVVVE